MPGSRGLVPPAIIVSTIVLVACAVAWGALGMFSVVPASAAMPLALHRYISTMLATLTVCAMMVHLTARIIRAIRESDPETVCGYADGYTDGLDARPGAPVSPAMPRLVRTPR